MATKKEILAQEVARAVGAGKAVALETVDFNDPNRPKTCLEVDFPILPVNQVAIIEGNAGKPIYQMSKWWARRRSSVFRSMLIAAATSYRRYDDVSGDPVALNRATLAKLAGKPWSRILADHQADHRALFRRVDVDFGRTRADLLPTLQHHTVEVVRADTVGAVSYVTICERLRRGDTDVESYLVLACDLSPDGRLARIEAFLRRTA